MDETEKLLRLQTMVLCDVLPDTATPIYLVGETQDNQWSVFERADEWNRLFPGCSIGITGGMTTGYPGGLEWAFKLTTEYRIPRGQIHIISLLDPLNTLTEMAQLVAYASSNRWVKLVLTAAPFHQMRSFLTIIGVMRKQNQLHLKVFNLPGKALPWQQVALHSQGVLKATREGLIGAELERIGRYTAKGDLATADQALAYLRWRDQLR